MKHALSLLFSFLLVSAAMAVPGDVITSFPTPGNAPTGLAFDGQNLWVADRLSDTLYALDPISGAIAEKLAAPGFVPLGLAWDGSHLWCIDGEENRICELDVKTGITLRSLEAPTTKPEGLAWDGKYLWLSDGADDVICQISTDDGTTVVSFRAPSDVSTGLAWWNGYLWCADRRDDRIYLFDPSHGEVVFGLDAPGKYARGLATDGKVLWNADYQDDRIYALMLNDSGVVKVTDSHALHCQLVYEFRNYGPGDVPSLDVYMTVPSDLPNQRLFDAAHFTPQPADFVSDRWNQKSAHFHLENPPLAARERITMDVSGEFSRARWFIYPDKVGSLKDIPKAVRDAYLVDEDKYRITDPIIRQAVKEAVGNETNPYWMMRKIHKYVRDHLIYELAGGWNVAPQVLTRGNGSCSEYTFLFISMCRAAGIPARYVGSIVVRGDDASTDEYFHRWSQVYMPGFGWLHVDPQGGDKDKPAEVAASIGNIDNRFLITTEGGGASEYLDWSYNYNDKWTSHGPVKVHVEALGEWSPAADDSSSASGASMKGDPNSCKIE